MFKYIEAQRKQEFRQIFKALIPEGVLRLRNYLRFRRAFPQAFISAGSTVDLHADIGNHCVIRECMVGSRVRIGNFTTIGNHGSISGLGSIDIGKFCCIGPDVFIRSENHAMQCVSAYPFEQLQSGLNKIYQEYLPKNISIGHDVWIGARVSILGGAKIGTGCIIAAGAVVGAGSYPDYSLIGGVPAKTIKMRFDQDTIDTLLKLEWWNKDEDYIFDSLMPILHSPPNSTKE